MILGPLTLEFFACVAEIGDDVADVANDGGEEE